MRRILLSISLILSTIAGAALVLFIAAEVFEVNVFGLFITSATKLVGVLGAEFPILNTRYGALQLRSQSTSKGQLVEIGCASCRIENKLLASQPFKTSSAILSGYVKRNHFSGKAVIEEVTADLEVDWAHFAATGSFNLPETDISKLYNSLRTIIPEATKAKITGTLKGSGKFTWPEINLLFQPTIKDFSVSDLIDKQKYTQGSFEYHAEDMDGKDITMTSGEGTPNWTPLSSISKHLPAAVIAIEDRGFYVHKGFDIESIVSATNFNKRLGKVKRGGSTITQQLSKNLFLTDERTYARKLRELIYAVEIDRELGKKRIMELYLNIVEFGPNIFGVKMAAQTYFRKTPAQLLPEEAAWLAAILRSPKKAYKNQFLAGHPNMMLVGFALGHMGSLSEEERSAALERRISFAK